jgi:hypothetical protein
MILTGYCLKTQTYYNPDNAEIVLWYYPAGRVNKNPLKEFLINIMKLCIPNIKEFLRQKNGAGKCLS